MNMQLAAIVSLAIALAACGPKPDIRVENAWARRAPMIEQKQQSGVNLETGNSAVYATILNNGHAADLLVAAASDAAGAVELHETYEMSGMMMMRSVPNFAVPPGGKLEMKPGGYHLMLLRLKRELKPGEKVGVSLTFEKAGTVSIDAVVK